MSHVIHFTLSIFKTTEFGSIRVMEIDGQPWFVGKDVAESLGYKDIKKAVRMHVEEEDKGGADLSTPGGKQKTVIINESGLYSLIMSSKLPTAKQFKRWVTSEVLPRNVNFHRELFEYCAIMAICSIIKKSYYVELLH